MSNEISKDTAARGSSVKVTVAAVAAARERFLMVEETIDGRRVVNQPAGHLEAGESLIEAVRRETLEETRWDISPTALLGVYRIAVNDSTTILRFAFAAEPIREHTGRSRDPIIDAVHWMTLDEVLADPARHRTPLVAKCIEDYLAGIRLPLTCLHDFI